MLGKFLPRLGQDRLLIHILRLFWVGIVLWYELGVFIYGLDNCRWPTTNDSDSLFSSTSTPKNPHILVVADPQILNHRSYPSRSALLTLISRVIVDLNLRKNWRTALQLRPDAIVFLGDMMDGGRYPMSDQEYASYYGRFRSIFSMAQSTPIYYLPGNHDVGLGTASSSDQARPRYLSHFGPLNYQASLGNYTFVFLDGPDLVEEDYQRAGQGLSYDRWSGKVSGPTEFVKKLSPELKNEPVILFTHIPLSRPDGAPCGPLRERGTIRRGVGFGYQNTLAKGTTEFLLSNLHPSLVLSGDDHDYCEYTHKLPQLLGPVREVTVKSFSMAMGIRRPGFQLLSLPPPSLGPPLDTPCLLPDQIGIYVSVYVPFLLISLSLIFTSKLYRLATSRRRGHTLSSPTNEHDEEYVWISSSQPQRSDVRSRSDVEADDESSTSKGEDSPVNFLHIPTHATNRTSMPHGAKTILQKMLSLIRSPGPHRRRKKTGLFFGFLSDAMDVAWLPLLEFSLINVLILLGG